MNLKLIITKHTDTVVSALFDGMNMVQVSLSPADKEDILGNIYLGKVKNIVNNINAAFVEIADGRMCYYSITENRHPIVANRVNQNENEKQRMSRLGLVMNLSFRSPRKM